MILTQISIQIEWGSNFLEGKYSWGGRKVLTIHDNIKLVTIIE